MGFWGTYDKSGIEIFLFKEELEQKRSKMTWVTGKLCYSPDYFIDREDKYFRTHAVYMPHAKGDISFNDL